MKALLISMFAELNQNLVLWDNIKNVSFWSFFFGLYLLQPNLTNKVIVSKTEQVLNIVMVFPVPSICIQRFGYNTFSGGAGINSISADAFLEIPITKKLELHISGRRSITDLKSPYVH
jgi:hypothetical protein